MDPVTADIGGGVLLLIVLLILYFLPAAVASARDHHNKNAIFLLNIFLGWTFLGWVIALIWSATGIRKAPPPQAGITVTLSEEQAAQLGITGAEKGR